MIEDAFDHLIGVEGGYSNNPIDGGGETMWGITVKVAREAGYEGPMAEMPRETAVGIYKHLYWHAPAFDIVDTLSPLVAQELLDTGVNMGPQVASGFLQRALNALGASLSVDGAVGRMTIKALRVYLFKRGDDGINVLLRLLNAQQAARYLEIVENDPRQRAFLFGWILNRVS